MNNDINEKIVHAAPVPPFVRFVASAVPMVFDNSLSYYEALCALWKWMQDNLVNVVNNNATVTEHYIEITNELKEYVENYFANLDVQDEINNKLDEMVEAGTLQEIITSYIQNNVAWTFDTVTDMKQATNLVAGSYARTIGFRTINDGGGATYFITDSGTANEMDVIAVDGLYANLVIPNTITPIMLGAYGDGNHDDTAYITRNISLTNDVNLANKSYQVSDTLTITKSNFKIHDGNIDYTKNSGALITLSGAVKNVEIYNLTIEGHATASTNIQCIANPSGASNDFYNINIHNNVIHDFNLGISINADLSGDFKNCTIKNNKVYNIYGTVAGVGYGIHVANGGDVFTNTIIEGNEIYNANRHCIYVARGSGYTIQHNYVHDNYTPISVFLPAVNISRSKNIIFSGNKLEKCNNIVLWLGSELKPDETLPLSSYPCKNVVVENNTFIGPTNNLGVVIGYGKLTEALTTDVIFRDNHFENMNAFYIWAGKNITLDHNYFKPTAGQSAITLAGATEEQTSSDHIDYIYLRNNVLDLTDSIRPIRLNPNACNVDINLTLENNKVPNTHTFYASAAVSSNNIILINQAYDNDFPFASTYGFKPLKVNGQTVTLS